MSDTQVADHREEIERVSKAMLEAARRFTSVYRIGRDGNLHRVQQFPPQAAGATPGALRSVPQQAAKGRPIGPA